MGENQCPLFSLQRPCLVLDAALHFTCKYSGVSRWMLEKILPYIMVGFSNSSEESQYRSGRRLEGAMGMGIWPKYIISKQEIVKNRKGLKIIYTNEKFITIV